MPQLNAGLKGDQRAFYMTLGRGLDLGGRVEKRGSRDKEFQQEEKPSLARGRLGPVDGRLDSLHLALLFLLLIWSRPRDKATQNSHAVGKTAPLVHSHWKPARESWCGWMEAGLGRRRPEFKSSLCHQSDLGNFLTALGLRYLFSTVLTVSDLCNLPSASIPVRKSPKPLFSLIRLAGAWGFIFPDWPH